MKHYKSSEITVHKLNELKLTDKKIQILDHFIWWFGNKNIKGISDKMQIFKIPLLKQPLSTKSDNLLTSDAKFSYALYI